MSTWLLIDSNYLCHRAYHAMGRARLEHDNISTGMLFGFFRDVHTLRELHATDNFVFCFDKGPSLRKQSLPCYKSSREEKRSSQSEEEQAAELEFRGQIKSLRKTLLPSMGFDNVFSKLGYEADDIIASVCLHLPKGDEAIIVSADHDLYQLLVTKRVTIWNPHKGASYTQKKFEAEFGVTPLQWVDVKAIAGCGTDDIPGVKGVGEKTAAKFLNGSLDGDSKKFKDIVHNNKLWKKNRGLVSLPYPGCPIFKPEPQKFDEKAWARVTEMFGMRSLTKKKKSEGFGLGTKR